MWCRVKLSAWSDPAAPAKSTAACVNGLEDIQGGRIVFDGSGPGARRDIIEVRKRIGMVFQQFNFYPHLTALQNVVLDRCCGAPEDRHLGGGAGASCRTACAPVASYRCLSRAIVGRRRNACRENAERWRPIHMALMFDALNLALDPETVGEVLAVMRDLRRGPHHAGHPRWLPLPRLAAHGIYRINKARSGGCDRD